MAKEKPFTSDIGVTFDKSYWRVSVVELCPASKTGRVISQGFAEEKTKTSKPISAVGYEVKPADYDKYFSIAELDKVNPIKKAYAFLTGKDEFKDAKDV